MINFIKINLLPYREEILQKKKKRFHLMMLLALGLGSVLAAMMYFSLQAAMDHQNNRNQFLTKETQKLDVHLEEINKLQEEANSYLARKQKIEELQNKRFQAATILDNINALIPEGAYLTSIKSEGSSNSYTFTGKAVNNNKIAIFMRSLPSTGIFSQPELLSIKKTGNTQEFVFKATLNSQFSKTELVATGASAPTTDAQPLQQPE